MNTADTHKTLVVAALGAVATAATLPAVALTIAPIARADCDTWGLPNQTAITWTQDYNTTGALVFPNPADSDPPWIASFAGTDAVSTFYPVGDVWGKAVGSVTGESVHFSVLWNDGKKGDYRGTVDQNGRVTGTTSGGGMTAFWHFDKPLVRCPAPPPAPATPPHPNGPVKALIYTTPPDVDIENVSGLDPGVVVTVKNPRGIDTHCKYEAVPRPPTLLQNSVHEFDIKAKDSTNFKIKGVPTGTTWDVTVSCHAQLPAVLTHQF